MQTCLQYLLPLLLTGTKGEHLRPARVIAAGPQGLMTCIFLSKLFAAALLYTDCCTCLHVFARDKHAPNGTSQQVHCRACVLHSNTYSLHALIFANAYPSLLQTLKLLFHLPSSQLMVFCLSRHTATTTLHTRMDWYHIQPNKAGLTTRHHASNNIWSHSISSHREEWGRGVDQEGEEDEAVPEAVCSHGCQQIMRLCIQRTKNDAKQAERQEALRRAVRAGKEHRADQDGGSHGHVLGKRGQEKTPKDDLQIASGLYIIGLPLFAFNPQKTARSLSRALVTQHRVSAPCIACWSQGLQIA